GQFFNSLTGQIYDELLVLLLDINIAGCKYRLWDPSIPQNYDCQTRDGMSPDGTGRNPERGPCRRLTHGEYIEICEHLQWTGDGRTRKPPSCTPLYSLLLWDIHHATALIYNAKKKSYPIIQRLNTTIQLHAHTLADRDRPDIPPRLLDPMRMATRPHEDYYLPCFEVLTSPNERMPTDYVETQIIPLLPGLTQKAASTDVTEMRSNTADEPL
ncbi:unnamed protein product, partial [marine sediment metagenome]